MSCCKDGDDASRGSILYSILNRGAACPRGHPETRAACPRGHPETRAAHRRCSCASKRRLVALRAPQSLFAAASGVLVKTFHFVKNVPCFRGLPAEDQLRLVRHGWAPLLLLGLVQERVGFDAVEPSLLRGILTHGEGRQRCAATDSRHPGVPVSDAEGIQMFLVKCRGLGICVKEYAFLKGAILFTPVTELECREYVEALRTEAERALYEHVRTAHRGNAGRFGRLRAVLNALLSVDPDSVAGLFFRPVTSSVDQHVLAMFHEQSPQ